MISSVKKLFNDSTKELKRMNKLVDKVNQLEEKFEAYSDEELRQMKDVFREELANGKTLTDIQCEAFAVVREGAKRVLGLRHYDVQLIGGFVLHEGSIAQMNTGEGKTLVATLSSYLHALEDKGVHIITANEYLAKRDKELMGQVHEFLGLTVGLNISQMPTHLKREAYQADITYGTGTEFGFDYLRDNMVYRKEDKVQRGHHYAIVDEIDSILIDEARTPLIIAGMSSEAQDLFPITAHIMKSFKEDEDFEVFAETKQTYLTDEGANKIERAFGIDNLYDPEHQELLHNVTQALKAHAIMKLDADYIVKDGKIHLIDKFTGRVMEGRTFSDGLHQAIEAKEGVEITEENETQATITIQNYFRLYQTLSGMTGSATPSKSEFWETYNLKVVTIPTNKPVQRIDQPDLIYKDLESKLTKIVSEVNKIHSQGRPILIGTTSIEQSESLSVRLKKENIPHLILNAKTEEDEARIIAEAGRKGQVMIATNMAGRGTDILLDEEVKELGGLYILGTERHESNRIDMQLRGRSGRQGDPGTSQFIISLEDELFSFYDEEEHERYMKKIKTDDEGLVLSPAPEKYMKKVQQTIEQMHQGARSHLLKLENSLNEQSKIIYAKRDELLELTGEEIFIVLKEYIESFIMKELSNYFPEQEIEEEEALKLDAFIDKLTRIFPSVKWADYVIIDNRDALEEKIQAELESLQHYFEEVQSEELGLRLRAFILNHIDVNWMEHLDKLTSVKEGITLSGYGQMDPYQLFEKRALDEFNHLMEVIESDISLNFKEYMIGELADLELGDDN